MTNTLRAGSFKFGTYLSIAAGLILLACAPFITTAKAHGAEVINAWWPTSGSHMTGTQPFKAVIPNLDVSSYEMFWQVDGGQLNAMDSNYSVSPHKETSVDLTNWTWHGSGPYVINFVAKKNGSVVASSAVTITVDNGLSSSSLAIEAPVAPVTITDVSNASAIVITDVTTRATAPTSAQRAVDQTVNNSSDPLSAFTFYVNPYSVAAQQAKSWASSNPSGALIMQKLAAQSTAVWLGEWNSNVTQDVQTVIASAKKANSVPVFVAYAIPQRDCGGYSSGGTNNPSAYSAWIKKVADGIGGGNAVVILEPDALSQIDCLSSADQASRTSLISSAVSTLKSNSGTKVYIDAGHSGWTDAGVMAKRLNSSNISAADGFALNVSNFMSTSDETSYGKAISSQTGNKHFVIDTSRNGNGSNGSWCNPSGRAIGVTPTARTGNSLTDAYLWLKVPGESDGTCNGGPSAGSWWPSYAVSLVTNAH
ncbi:MAG: Glucanase [Parcubacteria group bacterium]|nr:Glucanase [Parcubacteria group bacterium]